MKAPARMLMGALDYLRQRMTVDQAEIREELQRSDPDFARVSAVQHDAMNVLAGREAADGLSIRREREFWERAGK